MPWPERRWICLDCRRLAMTRKCRACPLSDRSVMNRMTDLQDHLGRERLLEEVWGPKSLRRRLQEAGKVGAGGALGTAVFQGCDVTTAFDLDGIFIVFIVFALLWLGICWIVEVLRQRKERRGARGARLTGAVCERVRGAAGVVVSNQVAAHPLSSVSCVAYAAELRDGRRVMLRDAVTIGFDVQLASGDLVRVPPGPLLIDMTDVPELRTSRIEAYRCEVDPLRRSAIDLDPLPGEKVILREVRPGDPVELIGELERVPTAGGTGGYRESAASVLVPRGLVRLRSC